MIFFPFFKKIGFLGILGPPYCGIGATIRIGREMLCLPYAGFLILISPNFMNEFSSPCQQGSMKLNMNSDLRQSWWSSPLFIWELYLGPMQIRSPMARLKHEVFSPTNCCFMDQTMQPNHPLHLSSLIYELAAEQTTSSNQLKTSRSMPDKKSGPNLDKTIDPKEFTDVPLVLEDAQKISAHSVVLATISPTTNNKECNGFLCDKCEKSFSHNKLD